MDVPDGAPETPRGLTLGQQLAQLFRNVRQFTHNHPVVPSVLLLILLLLLDPFASSKQAGGPSTGFTGDETGFTYADVGGKKVLSDDIRPEDGVRVVHLESVGDETFDDMVKLYVKRADAFPLHVAAYHGDTERLAKLLSLEKTEPNQKGINWETPLHVAVKYSQLDTIRLLLASRAQPDRRATTVYPFGPGLLSTLHYAVLYTNGIAATELLLKAGADPYAPPSAFRFACKEGRADLADLMLNYQPLGLQQRLGKDERDSLLSAIAAGTGWTPNLPAQLRLLRRVLDMDPSLARTLDAWAPQDDILHNLANQTAAAMSVALRTIRPRLAPLHLLALQPRDAAAIAEAMQLLLDRGANVNVMTDTRWSVLDLLVSRCDVDIAEPAQVLIAGGIADVQYSLGLRQSRCPI
ncbi:ankyrin repeat-containing domain protein [Phlyctochytrium arcticum]|nr:ankyrin repeat-containing domain protein [Phlyctochytrium arcticum]